MAFIEPQQHPAPVGPWPSTDLGVATRVVDTYGHRLRYCQSEECFYIYSGGRWGKEKLKGGQRFVTDACVSQRADHPEVQTDVTSAGFIKRVIFHVQGMLAIDGDEFDRVTGVLNFRNGVLDLTTGELFPHQPGLYLRQQIPYDWRPDASYAEWMKHLMVMTKGNKEIMSFLQLLMGATLWGGSDRDQVFIHLMGKGRQGKGVFMRALGKALGNYYAAAPVNLFSMGENAHTTEFMTLKGSRMVACSEIGTNRLNIGTLKMLTGGDEITARQMRSNPVTFPNTWIIWLATNYSLNTTGDASDALFARYIPINLGESIPEGERDNTIEERLHAEVMSSGIVKWAVEGCMMWREMGNKVPIPDSVREWRADERESSDVFGSFMSEKVDVTYDQTHKLTLQELATAYEVWRISNNENLRMSSKMISADLRSRYGLTVKAGAHNKRTAFGLKWLSGDNGLGL